MENWRVLVVDDEEDVHLVTGLALKRRNWKGRPFALTAARSAEDAKRVLASGEPFHVALVDVVMETDHAGLDLCEHIRNTQPRWTRIILRTGQPGVAPEDKVLNDFDIDFYLAKADVTQERLYATTRACLRSSQDISTLIAVTDQLQDYIGVIQQDDTLDELVQSFSATLGFLEEKYGAAVAVVTELAESHRAECLGPAFAKLAPDKSKLDSITSAATAATRGAADFSVHKVGDYVALPFAFVNPSASGKKKGFLDSLSSFLGAGRGWAASGCVLVKLDAQTGSPERILQQFVYDLRLFCQNWKLAYQLLCAQRAISDAASGVVW